ncbi:MAG TPA: CPBP family intramembrane glutamic endopeptidase [Phycisphaerales bacterium]|nr:CPBP family intramembrane glutamic endopeptidase [Phycisphaerales bacterium]
MPRPHRRAAGIATGSMLMMMLILTLAIGSEVIAATADDDQQATESTQAVLAPAATAPDQSSVWLGLGQSDLIALVLAAVSLAVIIVTRWHRLDSVPTRPAAFTPASALFLLAMIYLLAPLGSGLGMFLFGIKLPEGESAPPLAFEDTAKLQLMAIAARLLGVVAFIMLLRRATRLQPDRRASLPSALALGAGGLLLVWPLVTASISLAGWITGAPSDRIAHETLRELIQHPAQGWGAVMIVLVTAVVPVVEEVMYRGLLQESIRRAGAKPWPTIVLASIVFALAHVAAVQPHALIGLFVFGLGLGWAYERTGRLWAPIAMHALFNAGNLMLARMTAG